MKSAAFDWGALVSNIPNAISASRLAATPLLLYEALAGGRGAFKWILLACLLSDIADGLIARGFDLTSELGARLDSAADLLVFSIGAVGLFAFEGAFLSRHYAPILCVIALYVVEVIAALVRYGRISSFHTVLTRVSAYTLGIFVMSLFLWGYSASLFWAAIALSVLAYTEELAIVWMLPEWRADVRGLFWIRRGSFRQEVTA